MEKENKTHSINHSRRKLLSLAGAAGTAALLSPLLSKAAPSTIIEAGSGVDTASYIIFKDGDTIYAKNGTTGKIDYSETDISTILTSINGVISGGDTILIKQGIYAPGSKVIFTKSVEIIGEGEVIFNWTKTGYGNTVLQFNGTALSSTTITGDVAKGANTIVVTNVGSAIPGDLLNIYDDTIWNPDEYPINKTAELHEISSISGNNITIKDKTINTFATTKNGTVVLIRPITIEVRGININGPGATVEGFGIGLYYTKNSIIKDSKFQNCGWTSIQIERSYYPTVENNVIGDNNYYTNTGYGTSISAGTAYAIIRNNRFYNARHAIALGTSGIVNGVPRDIWVVGNIFDVSIGISSAIDAHNGESYYIYNNTFYTNDYAVQASTKITKFVGNTVIGGYGVRPRGSPPYATHWDISNNTFIDTAYIFRYSQATDIIDQLNIKNNTITGNINAITQAYNLKNFIISGNQFYSTKATGEEVIGILNSTKGIISNNIVRNASGTVIRLRQSSNYNLISNNQFLDWRSGSAILIQDSNNNTVSNNLLSATTSYGIQESGTSNYNRFLDNDLTAVGTIIANRISIVGINTQLKNNTGYLTENSGLSIGTGVQQTIPHGLATIPTRQQIALTSGSSTANPYHSAAPDATNIYVTATNNQPWYWATVGT